MSGTGDLERFFASIARRAAAPALLLFFTLASATAGAQTAPSDTADTAASSTAPLPAPLPNSTFRTSSTARRVHEPEFVTDAGRMCASTAVPCILGSGGGVVARLRAPLSRALVLRRRLRALQAGPREPVPLRDAPAAPRPKRALVPRDRARHLPVRHGRQRRRHVRQRVGNRHVRSGRDARPRLRSAGLAADRRRIRDVVPGPRAQRLLRRGGLRGRGERRADRRARSLPRGAEPDRERARTSVGAGDPDGRAAGREAAALVRTRSGSRSTFTSLLDAEGAEGVPSLGRDLRNVRERKSGASRILPRVRPAPRPAARSADALLRARAPQAGRIGATASARGQSARGNGARQ